MRRAIVLAVFAALIAAPSALAASPSVTTGGATGITSSAAALNGTVNPGGQATKYAFQYGPTAFLGFETALTSAGSGTSTITVKSTVGGLMSGTTYFYRIIAIGGGGTATGKELTLKTTGTPPVPAPPPTVTTGSASAIVSGGATVSGTVNPQGRATAYHFEFGTTVAYGFQTTSLSAGSGTVAAPVSATLSGLAPNQTYHYRVVGTSTAGTSVGADAMFRTATGGSTFKIFGHTAFVAPGGEVGVFVGCIGQSPCTGGLILRHSRTVGVRQAFFVAASDGGIVHLRLNARGRALLASNGQLDVRVILTATNGQVFTKIITLRQFI